MTIEKETASESKTALEEAACIPTKPLDSHPKRKVELNTKFNTSFNANLNVNLNAKLIAQDLATVWHPCSQMKGYETFPPVIVTGAKGVYLHLDNGNRLIDAVSSWWCKTLGHGHPRLRDALKAQADHYEHVMLAQVSHPPIIELSQRLTQLFPTLKKVTYAGDGSCAVEIAMKMSVHARMIRGETQRHEFLSLSNAYHGETSGAMAVSDLGLYRRPYESMLMPCHYLKELPYVHSRHDPLWHDCGEVWPKIEAQLAALAERLTAVIVEPVLQGAGGMMIYSPDLLRRLRQWTQQQGIHLIADEILTGFGRTGLPFGCDHAAVEPDFLCLGKSLTAGWLPMSAVVTTNAIYDEFYSDDFFNHSFLHSHTFAGNPLAASVALATLEVISEEGIYDRLLGLETQLLGRMRAVAEQTGQLVRVRGVGGVVAADLLAGPGDHETPVPPRFGQTVFKAAVERGALLRPLGNTIYWLPPLTIQPEEVDALAEITAAALYAVRQKNS